MFNSCPKYYSNTALLDLRYSDLSNTSQFSVAKHLHETDEDRHTNQQMYSCGSLAPKLKKRGGGCMNHSFNRKQELWEATDGALFLLSEVSEIYPNKIAEFLPTVVEVSRCRHFFHAMSLQVCKNPKVFLST